MGKPLSWGREEIPRKGRGHNQVHQPRWDLKFEPVYWVRSGQSLQRNRHNQSNLYQHTGFGPVTLCELRDPSLHLLLHENTVVLNIVYPALSTTPPVGYSLTGRSHVSVGSPFVVTLYLSLCRTVTVARHPGSRRSDRDRQKHFIHIKTRNQTNYMSVYISGLYHLNVVMSYEFSSKTYKMKVRRNLEVIIFFFREKMGTDMTKRKNMDCQFTSDRFTTYSFHTCCLSPQGLSNHRRGTGKGDLCENDL